MSRLALVVVPVLVALAACSKQEPAPPSAAANPATAQPKPSAGAELAPPSKASSPAQGGASSAPTQTREAKVAATPPAPPAPATPPTPAEPPVGLDGAAIFEQTCATCHMADGGGVPYLQPSIKGSAWISNPDPQLLLSLILRGSAILGEAAKAYDNDMPPVDALSDAEIAAVATYVRGRFGAPPVTEPVTPAQVAIARARPGLPE